MPEDAGKKKFIKDFLQQVKAGEGHIEDIRIERIVRLPGSAGEGSTARSLSGRQVGTLSDLLEDDLRHSFDEGYFTFRFVAALVGSGKTSLLTYLHELIKTRPTYEQFSVVNRFRLSDLLSTGGSNGFSVKLYGYILAQTFFELLHSSSIPLKDTAKSMLNDYLEPVEVNQLMTTISLMPFYAKFSKFFSKIEIVFEDFFFDVICKIAAVEPRFTFAYLIDELDALQNFQSYLQETRSLMKALVKRASEKFGYKIRLLIYLVGTSENVGSFISEDAVIESLVGDSVINLNKGYENEFGMIRARIDKRIELAFKGYKNFPAAWKEIKSIPLNSSQSLRRFCQEYAAAVLEIHEKYFNEEPEKSFEGNARELVKSQCIQKWGSYLSHKSYSLSSVSTTTILGGHAFDCYIELLHNGKCAARGFGEAKNYELLTSHLETLNKWLSDVGYKSSTADKTPPDLAFMIAPSCPSLLQRKLEIENIHLIQTEKVIAGEKDLGVKPFHASPVNINAAEKELIIMAWKGTRIKATTVEKLINLRCNRINGGYQNLDELVADLKLTLHAKEKLQEKLDSGHICFA